MIISVNWLKKFTDIDCTIDELVTLIGARLVEIEGVEYIGDKYKDVIVAKVIESSPLEGSDHLSFVKIDDGGVRANVDRDEAGLIQVVCGAPNVRAGIFVAWLPPESVVPETFGSEEPFVLSARPLRGVVSNGMLASARELDLYDDHDGIIEVDKQAKPGDSFAELYELNDYLLDIENKSLTHRPDAFGLIGFAREIAGIQGKSFETPEWLTLLEVNIMSGSSLPVPAVSIDDQSLSGRFQAIVLGDIDENTSLPIQMQTYMARSGVRPISTFVDISNYIMLLTGQPTHTYDYDKLKAVAGDDFTLRVRSGREGETLTLLDGRDVSLDPADIVIACGDTPVGLAGMMGGSSTAVDENTRAVVLEVATFNLYNLRSSQMRHGIFSEAVTRFTKGIPALFGAPVLAEFVSMAGRYAGTVPVSGISQDYPGESSPIQVQLTADLVNSVLGTHFLASDISAILQNVGFLVDVDGVDILVKVPYWRQDIRIAEDIAEEVGRLAGFDTINASLPMRSFEAVAPSAFDKFRSGLRGRLVRGGANEVLTYSFIHGDTLVKVGQQPSNSYKIINSISPELQYYRQSLTPSLLSYVSQNIKAGFGNFALFEANKVHLKSDGLTDESVPVERDNLALVLIDAKANGDAYYNAKMYLEYLLEGSGAIISFEPLGGATDAIYAPFEPKRSAIITCGGVTVGVVGEYKKAIRKAFKLPDFSAGFEVNVRTLLSLNDDSISYEPLSRYPGSERDVCFQVSSAVPYSEVYDAVVSALSNQGVLTHVSPLDLYQAEGASVKNITVRVRVVSYEKTMTTDDVSQIIDKMVRTVEQATGGKVV